RAAPTSTSRGSSRNRLRSSRPREEAMKKALLALLALWFHGAMAAVINFEVQFTPFTGDIAKSEVQTVAGKASVFLNNVPIAEQDVEKKSVPVLFDNREIAPAVWVPTKSLG